MSTIQQTLRCSGEIIVSTDLNTSEAQKGRIVFVDKTNENRVIAGLRIYGTPQSRLIVDAYNTANGLAFRTNVNQGTTTEGGTGLSYGFEILPLSVKSTLPYWVVEPSASQSGPELGALMMRVGRYGTANVVSASPQTRYLSLFFQNTFKTNEQIQIGVGSLNNDHSVYGFQPLFASNGQPIGGTTFFGHSTSTFNEPLKCILYDQTGKVTIPGTIRATTYENLPPIPAADLLPITLDKVNNNVGINQTIPTVALDVIGDGKFSGQLNVLGLASANTLSLQAIPNSVKPDVLMYDPTTKQVSYGPGTPDLLPITLDKVNSRVGINNPVPAYALDVSGEVNIPNANAFRIATKNGLSFQGSDFSTVAVGQTGTIPSTSTNAVAIGMSSNAGNEAVSIGLNAGNNTQGNSSVAVGVNAGRYTQGGNAVAIGGNAGSGTTTAGTGQGASAVAVGNSAGQTTQGTSTVAVGNGAGRYFQGNNGVAIGTSAGSGTTTAGTGQGASGIAIGLNAGVITQGQQAIAIGQGAGNASQGSRAIAIGFQAGVASQHANSIILNAENTALNSTAGSSLYVKPIRNVVDATMPRLSYNATTGEIMYGNSTTDSLLPITLDKTNNRVGINKTNPTTALDVAGVVTASGMIVDTGSVSTPTLSLTGIPNSVKTDVLYYDTTTKAVSYGAAPAVSTPSITTTSVTSETLTTGVYKSFCNQTLQPGYYIATALISTPNPTGSLQSFDIIVSGIGAIAKIRYGAFTDQSITGVVFISFNNTNASIEGWSNTNLTNISLTLRFMKVG